MATRVIILINLIFLAACSVTDRTPIVDLQGVNIAQYNQELADCQNYADRVDGEQEIELRTTIGVIAGAAIGITLGEPDFVQYTAGLGAVSGATEGTVNVIEERNTVLRNCLQNRATWYSINSHDVQASFLYFIRVGCALSPRRALCSIS